MLPHAHDRFLIRQLVLFSIMLACVTVSGQTIERPMFVMKRDGTGLKQVASVVGKYSCGSPSWAPDGKWIAFDAHGPNFSAQHVYIVDLESGKQIDVGSGGFPAWAPDHKSLAFHRTDGPTPEIWLVDPDGRNPRLLIENASHPRWSPDGKQMSFLMGYGQNLAIYDVASQEQRDVFDEPTPRLYWGQSWSPDGKRISLIRDIPDGGHELVIVNTEGSSRGLRVRYRGHMSSHTNWSSDGKHILIGLYAARNGARHLHFLDPDGREAPVELPGQDPKFDYCDGAWSRDAKQVAFSRTLNVRAAGAKK